MRAESPSKPRTVSADSAKGNLPRLPANNRAACTKAVFSSSFLLSRAPRIKTCRLLRILPAIKRWAIFKLCPTLSAALYWA